MRNVFWNSVWGVEKEKKFFFFIKTNMSDKKINK